jgi:hypothetical protein
MISNTVNIAKPFNIMAIMYHTKLAMPRGAGDLSLDTKVTSKGKRQTAKNKFSTVRIDNLFSSGMSVCAGTGFRTGAT